MLTTVAAYLPALSGSFLIDDDVLLTESRLIKAADGIYRFWFTGEAVDYWPVSNTMLWLEWRLWGMQPTGYHVTNLVLHLIESLLVWRILQRLAIPGAFLAALLFALHPVNVESVAWIAQRKSLLAMLFSLLSVLAYLRAEAESRLSATDGDVWYRLALGAFALALLSKISAIVLLPLLLLIVGWTRPLARRDLLRAVPFLLVALLLVAVNLWFRVRNVEIAPPTSDPIERLLTAASVVWFYLYKALLPLGLVFMYPRWQVHPNQGMWWLPLIAAASLFTVLWIWRRSWSRGALFAWTFYVLALLPAMGFTEQLVIEDHYQHVALIAVVALVAAGWEHVRQQAPAPLRGVLNVGAVALVGVLVVSTRQQAARFTDNVSLMQTAVDTYPSSVAARRNLGFVLLKAGRLQEAKLQLEEALRIDPDDIEARKSLAATLIHAGQLDEAIGHLELVVRWRPDDPAAQHNLGELLRETGRPQDAIEHFEQSLRVKPDSAKAHCNLATALLKVGRREEAVVHLQRALQIDPDDRAAQHHLAELGEMSPQVR